MKRGYGQRGFTLIELIIVVAVIGILAATAMPGYQTYIRRATAVEAMSVAELGEKGVNEFYGRWGRFPENNAAAGLFPPEAYRGRYVQLLEVKDGVIRIVYNVGQGALQTYSLYFRPATPSDDSAGVLTWVCNQNSVKGFKVRGVIGTDLPPAMLLPTACR